MLTSSDFFAILSEADSRRRKEVEKQQQEKHNELIGQLK